MMGRSVLVFLVLAGIVTIQAMADRLDVGSETNTPQRVQVQRGVVGRVADPPASSREESPEREEGESRAAEAPENRRLGKHHHHSSDKSVAGGGVIIGGLVTAIFASVFCYIRVTRRRDGDAKLSGAN